MSERKVTLHMDDRFKSARNAHPKEFFFAALDKLSQWGIESGRITEVHIAATDKNEMGAAYYDGGKRIFYLAAIWDDRDEERDVFGKWSFHS